MEPQRLLSSGVRERERQLEVEGEGESEGEREREGGKEGREIVQEGIEAA